MPQRYEYQTPHGRDSYLIMDSSEIPAVLAANESRIRDQKWGSWTGDTYSSFTKKARTGDAELVSESDRFLEKLEDQIPHSRGWRVIDDVVGAVPNVPAMIAGLPQHMRRRQRTMKETAPLTIYMDLTSSGGINARSVTARGVTLLALTRILIEHRPVSLHVGASLGRNYVSGTAAWRIDTAPLDLARAAYHIGATAMSRGFGYGLCMGTMSTNGGWPFDNYQLHCQTAKDRLAAVFPGTEILYVPPIYLGDQMTNDPVGWIKRVLKQTTEEEE